VPDRLYLSCWIRGFNESNMLQHFEKLLEIFPFSKLSKRGPVLRVYAIEHTEPPIIERAFPLPTDPSLLVEAASELALEDCAMQVDGSWDLWQYEGDWKLEPAAVILSCLGPVFDNEEGDHLRIEFGVDSRFLPQPGIEGSLRMVQSNVRSLLHLVGEIDGAFDLERRQLWSESGVNFAEVLTQSVGSFHVN
jgi:hypothetical protein